MGWQGLLWEDYRTRLVSLVLVGFWVEDLGSNHDEGFRSFGLQRESFAEQLNTWSLSGVGSRKHNH